MDSKGHYQERVKRRRANTNQGEGGGRKGFNWEDIGEIISQIGKSKIFEEVVVSPICAGVIFGMPRAGTEFVIKALKNMFIKIYKLNMSEATMAEVEIREFIKKWEITLNSSRHKGESKQ